MVKANDELMLSSFLTGYPNNMQYGSIYSDHAKLCICGLNTEILGSQGKYMEMYRLAQAGWSWAAAYKQKRQSNWSNTAINNGFIGSAMWYSPGDASFVTMILPAKMMKSVIAAWVEIISQAEIEASVADCVPYISYFGPNWYETLTKSAKTPEERAEFASSHKVDKYWEYTEGTKFKMAYPDDFTAIKKTWADKKQAGESPKWLEVKKFPRVNAVVCEVTAKRPNNQQVVVDKPGNLIFADYNTEFKLITKLGKPLTFENGFEAANKLDQIGEKTGSSKKMIMSNNAFMWNEDLENIDLNDSAAVIENLVLPNTFEFTMCTNLLDPKSFGDYFQVTTEEWDKIWAYYKYNCPMIAFRGPLGYYVPDEEAGTKWLKRVPMYDKDHTNLFPMEPGSEKIVRDMKDIFIDPNSVEFNKNDGFDGILEAAKKGEEENDQQMKEEENKTPKDESPDSEIQDQDKPTQQDIEKAIEDAKKAFDSQATPEDDNEDNQSDQEEVDSNRSGLDETYNLPEPVIIKIKTCEERRTEIEEMFQDKNPQNEKQAAMMINLFMSHPHEHSCREFVRFEFNFNDDGGSVSIDQGIVLNWRVKRVNPFKYDPKQKDPNKIVFEVIFWNHYFEDQKDALYYIPAREVVNEWDKFPGILVDFEAFVQNKYGEVLTVPRVFDKFRNAIQKMFIDLNNGWNISKTGSGPIDLPGNSSAYQFDMIFDDPNENYVLHFFRIDSNSPRGYYDFIFQCWRIGEKYVMVKINGTQFNYSVLINIYSNEEKLLEIWNSIYKNIDEKYIGETGVVSLREIKEAVYHKMRSLATTKYKFGYEESLIPLPGDEYDEAAKGHKFMIESEHTNFLYNFLAADVDITVIVRGFVHFRENISVLNLYFSTDMFQSEYIIPLDDFAVFDGYLDDIFNECYMHMYMLLKQISIVESEDTTEEELDAEQKLGRYSMKKLLLTIVHMLRARVVYGCVDTIELPKTEMAYDENGNPKPINDINDMDDSFANQRVYKWTVTPPDNTGELLIRRSNKLFINIAVSRCEADDKMNPVLLHLYPTRMDDRNGYALTINSPSVDGSKDYKTTYHFVKYQDYAHMRVFEKFINKILNQMFDIKLPDEKIENNAE
jgi:hypothetical protein